VSVVTTTASVDAKGIVNRRSTPVFRSAMTIE